MTEPTIVFVFIQVSFNKTMGLFMFQGCCLCKVKKRNTVEYSGDLVFPKFIVKMPVVYSYSHTVPLPALRSRASQHKPGRQQLMDVL